MEYLPGLKKAMTTVLMICLTIVILCLLLFNNSYFENKFVVSLNGMDINARYDSEFRELLLIKAKSSNYIKTLHSTSELFYKIPMSNEYTLDVLEYEAYNKYGQRESYIDVPSSYTLKEVTTSVMTMKVQRMGETIYEGEFKNNITDIIKEEGRYYFHIYVKSKRTSSPIARVNTSLHFNILVVNNEKD